MNLWQKLIEVRKVLDYFQKDGQGFKYKYVKGQNILAKIKNKMDELGVILHPKISAYTLEKTDTGKLDGGGGKRFEYTFKSENEKGFMVFVNAENPEETIEITFPFIGTQEDSSKAFGSALTYSERYFLMKFFNIPTDEDDQDKWEKKHPINENFDEQISNLLIEIMEKDIVHPSEIEPIEDMIKNAKNEGQKIGTIKFLESKINDFNDLMSKKNKVSTLQKRVKDGLDSLKYDVTHRSNSIKKHLQTNTVSECNDTDLLQKYFDYIVEEYRKKQKEEF